MKNPRMVYAHCGSARREVPALDQKAVERIAAVAFGLTSHDSNTGKAEWWALSCGEQLLRQLKASVRAEGL